ncbi:MAG: cation:proton antiporter [Candidatus Promineifilaceae bacterium]|nr:cation:proton antiporter [Candidatus Promineifilaceae bacterium]
MSEHLLFGLAAIAVFAVGSQWLAWRLRLPSILLLLLFGAVAGPVTGLIDPDQLFGSLLFPIVSISVAIILFEGGLTLRLGELPYVGGVIFRLISIGALVTWTVAALAAHFIMGLDWDLSVLLGAILIVTGPTVIAPLLRQIQPTGQVGPALKWEGILIDPVGAVLAVLIFEAILAGEFEQATSVVIGGVVNTIIIGVLVGIAGAVILIFLFYRFLVPDHLENAVTLMLVVGAFALSNWLHPEAGLLTVTIMGLVLANQEWVSVKHIEEFKENLQVLLVGTLFILLSARLDPAVILGLGWESLLFLAVLIVIARPLAVLLSTWGSDMERGQRLFMTWMAPRGIVAASVASIFAFELVAAGHAGAEELVPLTFLVIMGTVAFYGLTAGPMARRLGLAEEDPQGVLIVGAHGLARAMAGVLKEHGFEVMLLDTNRTNVRQARLQGLNAHHGNAYSEEVLQELDLWGIGRLLAMTSNNEVNSLAALHFPEVFSRAEVYQLPVPENGSSMEERVSEPPQHLTGRYLFGSETTYNYLMEQFWNGAEVKATKLTPQFTYEDLVEHYEGDMVPLFAVTPKKKLRVYSADNRPNPKAGDVIISLAPPTDEAAG